MLVVVCFDISDDRIRYRVVKALLGYGVRVQKSVFECRFKDRKSMAALQERIEAMIDHGCDSVIYYPLCRECRNKTENSGAARPQPPEATMFA